MGLRSKMKRKLKVALGMENPVTSAGGSVVEPAPAPSKHYADISDDSGEGNLRDNEDVAWYLEYEDNDGWESTDVVEDGDED